MDHGSTGQTDHLTVWLLAEEPWTRHVALRDLGGIEANDPLLVDARHDMAADPRVRDLMDRAAEWPGYPLKRHNDAAHPLYAVATLADFGLIRDDDGVDAIGQAILGHFDGEQFETLLWLPRFLTKADEDTERWAWMLCDAPTLLASLVAFGYGEEPTVQMAIAALLDRADTNGWRCGAATSLPGFSGPGRAGDACPMATVYSLKALSLLPEHHGHAAIASGIDVLLEHWEDQADYKLRMFGIGTDFRKLRYPFVWYDILHVAEVLTRYPAARRDPRLAAMLAEITAQADGEGRFTAGAMFRSWKGWSFADKRDPSPWLTMLVRRLEARMRSDA